MKKLLVYIIGLILLIISFVFDKQIINFIANNRIEILNYFFIYLGYVSEWPILFLLTALVLYLKNKKLILRFTFLYIVTLAIIFFLKILTQVKRPDVALISIDVVSSSYSFPSGHATTIFLLLPIFIRLYPKQRYLWIILASVIIFSRLYVGVHYLSDIIFGALLGYSLSYLFFIDKKNK